MKTVSPRLTDRFFCDGLPVSYRQQHIERKIVVQTMKKVYGTGLRYHYANTAYSLTQEALTEQGSGAPRIAAAGLGKDHGALPAAELL